jgi:hypothetical protein
MTCCQAGEQPRGVSMERSADWIRPEEICSMPATISRGPFMIGHASPLNKPPQKRSRRSSREWER